ncbi:MAG: helix-turn-helix domain-containing protein [Acidimicrobiia bacterium]|nr:helix-turn-helix domain-containing protein [Acidimicrobiia bacterium]
MSVRANEANSPATSLRERKKAKTRALLIEVSQRLFAERGYDGTTLDDICDEVEITPQTLLRYFESKAHLALAPARDPQDRLVDLLEDPEREAGVGGDTIELWRRFLEREGDAVDTPTGLTTTYLQNLRAFRRWTDRDPVLIAASSDLERALRDALAAALAADRGAPTDDLHSMLIAALLVAGRGAVWDRWLDRPPEGGSLTGDLLSVVDYAVERLPRSSARRLLRLVE